LMKRGKNYKKIKTSKDSLNTNIDAEFKSGTCIFRDKRLMFLAEQRRKLLVDQKKARKF
jgi:hypothetical protein